MCCRNNKGREEGGRDPRGRMSLRADIVNCLLSPMFSYVFLTFYDLERASDNQVRLDCIRLDKRRVGRLN